MNMNLETLDFLDEFPEGWVRVVAARSRRDHWRWIARNFARRAEQEHKFSVLFAAQAASIVIAVIAVTTVAPWFSPAGAIALVPVMFAIECRRAAAEYRREAVRYWGLIAALDERMSAEREVPA